MGRSFSVVSLRAWCGRRHAATADHRAGALESARRFWFAFLCALASR